MGWGLGGLSLALTGAVLGFLVITPLTLLDALMGDSFSKQRPVVITLIVWAVVGLGVSASVLQGTYGTSLLESGDVKFAVTQSWQAFQDLGDDVVYLALTWAVFAHTLVPLAFSRDREANYSRILITSSVTGGVIVGMAAAITSAAGYSGAVVGFGTGIGVLGALLITGVGLWICALFVISLLDSLVDSVGKQEVT